ncbi:hypothetical protein Plhal304r1_c012g0046801 [Plasmopara halstedii]
MARMKLAFIFLTVIASTTSINAINWTFWRDDDDSPASTDTNNENKILSPETLTEMMGSDYMDRVREMIYSGKGSASSFDSDSGSSSSPASNPPISTNFSDDSDDSEDETNKHALLLPSSWDVSMPPMNTIATPSTAVSTARSTFRNWVGPWSQSGDSACYREAHFMNTCPKNYDRNDLTNTCWTECPMEYPVECGMQCIQENNDCVREHGAKVSALAMAILSSASFGVFGELAKISKTLSWAVICADFLLIFVRAVIRFARNQMVNDPQTTTEKLLLLLYQTNYVVADLPATILICSGKTPSKTLQLTRLLLPTVQYILLLVLSYKEDLLVSWDKFKAFMKHVNFTQAADQLTEGEIMSLESGMKQNSTCGDDLKTLTTHVWATVEEYRRNDPSISESELRLKISESDLILYDIPTVTNNCMPKMISESTEATAYKTRETIRKTFGVMINDLIKSGTSDNGVNMASKHSAYTGIRNALFFASLGWDPTDLATLLSEYLQTICGPTQFMGEIDDGNEYETLGMNALHKAFKNSSLSWTKKGDGAVILNFKSLDTKNVSINIMSGGDKIDEVFLRNGSTAQWRANITELGGKTLYLDRWHPGIFGIPSTGGGSLVLWVPISRQGGHLDLNVQLNAT